MKKFKKALIFGIFISLVLATDGMTAGGVDKEIKKQFSGKEEIKIDLVLGSCELVNSDDNNIYVHVYYTYDDENFDAIFRVKSKKILLKEDFHGNDADGESRWVIKVPKGMEIEFESATGDLKAEGLSKVELEGSSGTGDMFLDKSDGEFDLNSGTGDVEVTDCKGEFELNSGTGNVNIADAKGNFDLNSGTGDVYAENISIEDEAEFNSGTGEAEVKAPLGEDFDLSINSGTDDAILDMNGLPIEGYFELTAQHRRGSIVSPIKFDREEVLENGDRDKIRKSFTKGKSSPRYFISTGTGKAKLKK